MLFKACVSCDPGFYCPGDNLRYGCPNGTYSSVENTLSPSPGSGYPSCILCQPGEFCHTHQVTPSLCSRGFYSRLGDSQCHDCLEGHYCPEEGISYEKMLKTYICPAGRQCITRGIQDNVTTLDTFLCPTGHYCHEGTTYPFPCPAGTYNDLLGGKDILNCKNVSAGRYSMEGESVFLGTGPCAEGYYCPERSERAYAALCPAGKTSASGAATELDCVNCPAGYYCLIGNKKLECPAGYYCPEGSIAAIPCPKGSFNPFVRSIALSDCQSCTGGSYCSSLGASAVTGSCFEGYYCNNSASTPFPNSKRDTSGGECPPGYYCPLGTATPVACAVGTFNAYFKRETSCIQCTAGKFCNSIGLSAPSGECDAGYYCPVGSTNSHSVSTPPGYYSLAGSSEAIVCPFGTFSSISHARECMPCTPGHYCNETSLLSPKVCPLGHFCPIEGLKTSTPCFPGTFSNETSLLACLECEKGKFCSQFGLTSSEGDCLAGYFCGGGSNSSAPILFKIFFHIYLCYLKQIFNTKSGPCPRGHYCEAAASSPTKCPAGSYSNATKAQKMTDCLPCLPGKYCDKKGLIKPTGPCAAGYFCTSGAVLSNNSSNKCPAGYYCPEGSIVALPCEAGTYTKIAGQSSCLLCNEGFFCPPASVDGNATANICPAGAFCPEGTGHYSHYFCPPGTYNPTTGATSVLACLLCPAGSYCSNFGLTAATGLCQGGYACTGGSNTATPQSEACTFDYPIPGTSQTFCSFLSIKETFVSSKSKARAICQTINECTGIVKFSNGTWSPRCGNWSPVTSLPLSIDSYSLWYNKHCYGGSRCSVGFYCPIGSAEMVPCSSGNYCSKEGLLLPDGTCNEGYFCSLGSTVPTPSNSFCPEGHYCPSGITAPLACPAGKYFPVKGATNASMCELCPKGHFCLSGSVIPQRCPEGYYCPISGLEKGNNVSYICSLGHYCPEGTSKAISCDFGYFQDELGQAQCKICSPEIVNLKKSIANHYKIKTLKLKKLVTQSKYHAFVCDILGNYCPYESASEIVCPVGFFCPEKTKHSAEFPCPQGTASSITGLTSLSSCPLCPAGTLCTEPAATASFPCPAGYYCPHPGTVFSTPCPKGFYCMEGSIAPTACPVNFYCGEMYLSAPSGVCQAGFECIQQATVSTIVSPILEKIFPKSQIYSGVNEIAHLCSPGYYCHAATVIDSIDLSRIPSFNFDKKLEGDFEIVDTFENGQPTDMVFHPLKNLLYIASKVLFRVIVRNETTGYSESLISYKKNSGNINFIRSNFPSRLALTHNGFFLFISYPGANAIVKHDINLVKTTLLQGNSVSLNLNYPTGLSVDPTDTSLYISDSNNNRIIRYSLITGDWFCWMGVDCAFNGGTNLPLSAPFDVFASKNNGIFIADHGNRQIWQVFSNNSFKILNFIKSTSNTPNLISPVGLTGGNLYKDEFHLFISDDRINGVFIANIPNNTIELYIGKTNTTGLSGNGNSLPIKKALLNSPKGLKAYPLNSASILESLFIADYGNTRVARVKFSSIEQNLSSSKQPCPQGTILPSKGGRIKEDCLPCPGGVFCDKEGLSYPSGLCAAGYYCPIGSTSAQAIICPVGYHCPSPLSDVLTTSTYLNNSWILSLSLPFPPKDKTDICEIVKPTLYRNSSIEFSLEHYTIISQIDLITGISFANGSLFYFIALNLLLLLVAENAHFEYFDQNKQTWKNLVPLIKRNNDKNISISFDARFVTNLRITATIDAPTKNITSIKQFTTVYIRSLEPQACLFDSFSNVTGLSKCIACPPGKQCGGQFETPKDCPAGYYCIERNTSDATLTSLSSRNQFPCPLGTFSAATNIHSKEECTPCLPGKYCSKKGSMAVTGNCKAGFYCINSAWNPTPHAGEKNIENSENTTVVGDICPGGFYCPTSSAVPIPCIVPSAPIKGIREALECVPCLHGMYCPTPGEMLPCEGYICFEGSISSIPRNSFEGYICPAGYFCERGAIVEKACPPGTFSTSGAISCQPCPSGYVCPFSATSKVTERCPQGHKCPEGSIFPFLCMPGTFANLEGLISCLPCPKGSYCSEYGLKEISGPCAAGFLCTENATNPSPFNSYGDEGRLFGLCLVGHYCVEGGTDPLPCPEGTYQDLEGATICKSCTPGFYCMGEGLTAPTDLCNAGYYCEENSTTPTPAGYECPNNGVYCPKGSFRPLLCPGGTYNNVSKQSSCFPCPSNFRCLEHTKLPEICPNNKICPEGSILGSNCPMGAYVGLSLVENPPINVKKCLPCPVGYFCRNGLVQDKCSAGFFCGLGNSVPNPQYFINKTPPFVPFDEIITIRLINSDSLQFLLEEEANATVISFFGGTICPSGYYCLRGATRPLPCPFNTFRSAKKGRWLSDCQLCPTGLFCDKEGTSVPSLISLAKKKTKISACSIHSYFEKIIENSVVNNSLISTITKRCRPCPDKYTCLRSGMEKLTESDLCPLGFYCKKGIPLAIPCQAGTFLNQRGAFTKNNCTVCPGGFFCFSSATVTPQICPKGYFCPIGSSYPQTCPVQFFCPLKTETPLPCPDNYFCPIGSSAPFLCQSNESCAEKSGISLPCPQGSKKIRNNACQLCSPGTYSDATTVDCQKCPAGYLCVNGTSSRNPTNLKRDGGVMCPPGFYCKKGAVEATPCPAGTFNFQNGASTISDCQICGPFLFNPWRGQARCQICGASSLSFEDKTRCICLGANRYFRASDHACVCMTGFEYIFNGIDLSLQDEITPCTRKAFQRCLVGFEHDFLGRCINTTQRCREICGPIGGKYIPILGSCACEKAVATRICNRSCQENQIIPSLSATSNTLVLKFPNKTAMEYPISRLQDEKKIFSGNLSCKKTARNALSCPIYTLAATKESSLGLFGFPEESLQFLKSSANAAQLKRRLNKNEDHFLLRYLQTKSATPKVKNPSLCIESGSTVLWLLDSATYPIYQHSSPLNTNPVFDNGDFVDLALAFTNGTPPLFFMKTFHKPGIYVFTTNDNSLQPTLLKVSADHELCTKIGAIPAPLSQHTLSMLSGKNLAIINFSSKMTLLYPILILIFTVVILFGALYLLHKLKRQPVDTNLLAFFSFSRNSKKNPNNMLKIEDYLIANKKDSTIIESSKSKSTLHQRQISEILFSKVLESKRTLNNSFEDLQHKATTSINQSIKNMDSIKNEVFRNFEKKKGNSIFILPNQMEKMTQLGNWAKFFSFYSKKHLYAISNPLQKLLDVTPYKTAMTIITNQYKQLKESEDNNEKNQKILGLEIYLTDAIKQLHKKVYEQKQCITQNLLWRQEQWEKLNQNIYKNDQTQKALFGNFVLIFGQGLINMNNDMKSLLIKCNRSYEIILLEYFNQLQINLKKISEQLKLNETNTNLEAIKMQYTNYLSIQKEKCNNQLVNHFKNIHKLLADMTKTEITHIKTALNEKMIKYSELCKKQSDLKKKGINIACDEQYYYLLQHYELDNHFTVCFLTQRLYNSYENQHNIAQSNNNKQNIKIPLIYADQQEIIENKCMKTLKLAYIFLETYRKRKELLKQAIEEGYKRNFKAFETQNNYFNLILNEIFTDHNHFFNTVLQNYESSQAHILDTIEDYGNKSLNILFEENDTLSLEKKIESSKENIFQKFEELQKDTHYHFNLFTSQNKNKNVDYQKLFNEYWNSNSKIKNYEIGIMKTSIKSCNETLEKSYFNFMAAKDNVENSQIEELNTFYAESIMKVFKASFNELKENYAFWKDFLEVPLNKLFVNEEKTLNSLFNIFNTKWKSFRKNKYEHNRLKSLKMLQYNEDEIFEMKSFLRKNEILLNSTVNFITNCFDLLFMQSESYTLEDKYSNSNDLIYFNKEQMNSQIKNIEIQRKNQLCKAYNAYIKFLEFEDNLPEAKNIFKTESCELSNCLNFNIDQYNWLTKITGKIVLFISETYSFLQVEEKNNTKNGYLPNIKKIIENQKKQNKLVFKNNKNKNDKIKKEINNQQILQILRKKITEESKKDRLILYQIKEKTRNFIEDQKTQNTEQQRKIMKNEKSLIALFNISETFWNPLTVIQKIISQRHDMEQCKEIILMSKLRAEKYKYSLAESLVILDRINRLKKILDTFQESNITDKKIVFDEVTVIIKDQVNIILSLQSIKFQTKHEIELHRLIHSQNNEIAEALHLDISDKILEAHKFYLKVSSLSFPELNIEPKLLQSLHENRIKIEDYIKKIGIILGKAFLNYEAALTSTKKKYNKKFSKRVSHGPIFLGIVPINTELLVSSLVEERSRQINILLSSLTNKIIGSHYKLTEPINFDDFLTQQQSLKILREKTNLYKLILENELMKIQVKNKSTDDIKIHADLIKAIKTWNPNWSPANQIYENLNAVEKVLIDKAKPLQTFFTSLEATTSILRRNKLTNKCFY
ncbi:GCC2 and GCC3 domain-containing protein [Cardiosporidium cionae]|uniref:GCC2 and GCC3 domain-containing protein n=1 Tax=Cardiosporidium cionae TaxID=476202 RepID=A0ABQ7JDS6_9APIC|nr:GCC2 and GCC3 domain-containing protein [Cardiosporidium cionae]|eukprot:KAF8822159.1 GCC2 and GCC3 domain-containing protein [Cardiosporidium cionae]